MGWQHSVVISVPCADIGQALGPAVGLCGEATGRAWVYILANVRGPNKCVKAGLGQVNRWSGNGRVEHFTETANFVSRLGIITVATCVPTTTPLDVLSQDLRATEHRRVIHMWQRSSPEIHLLTGLSRHPKEILNLLSVEDGRRRPGGDGSRANRWICSGGRTGGSHSRSGPP